MICRLCTAPPRILWQALYNYYKHQRHNAALEREQVNRDFEVGLASEDTWKGYNSWLSLQIDALTERLEVMGATIGLLDEINEARVASENVEDLYVEFR